MVSGDLSMSLRNWVLYGLCVIGVMLLTAEESKLRYCDSCGNKLVDELEHL